MPDLQSELKKTLSAWEADAQQTQPDVKPKEQLNMTTQTAPATLTPKKKESQAKRIFDYITANPGNTHMGYAKDLVKQGFKLNSTTSLISQLIRNNLVNRDIEGRITPATTKYRIIKKMPAILQKHKPKRNLTLVVKKVVPQTDKQAEGIAAIATTTTTSPRMTTTWDAKVMIDNLSVGQARALYDELTKIFKG